jgi:hypothetical protein
VTAYLRTVAIGLAIAGFYVPAGADGPKKGGLGLGPETCGDHGTSVHFEKSVKDAAKKALKEEKLVLAIHISGFFEEPDYT